jgi:hypothetical protein
MNDSACPPLPNNRTSKLAVSSLVLGILGTFCCGLFAGFPAFICGAISLCQQKKHPATKNLVMALIAIALSAVSIFTTGVLAGLMVPGINKALESAKQTKELADIRQVGVMLFAYANDHEGKYPDSFEDFVSAELKDKSGAELDHLNKLFYQPKSHELRWKYTPGLTINSPAETVLLESADHSLHGKAVHTVGNTSEFIKDRPMHY